MWRTQLQIEVLIPVKQGSECSAVNSDERMNIPSWWRPCLSPSAPAAPTPFSSLLINYLLIPSTHTHHIYQLTDTERVSHGHILCVIYLFHPPCLHCAQTHTQAEEKDIAQGSPFFIPSMPRGKQRWCNHTRGRRESRRRRRERSGDEGWIWDEIRRSLRIWESSFLTSASRLVFQSNGSQAEDRCRRPLITRTHSAETLHR